MFLQDCPGNDEVENGVEVQHLGAVILAPADILQNLVKKSNDFISSHRHWLADFPHGPHAEEQPEPTHTSSLSTFTPPTSTSPHPFYALMTKPPSLPPSLGLRNPEPQLDCISQFCDCTPQVTAAQASQASIFSASVASISSSAAAQLANASSSLLLANNQIGLFTASIGFLSGGNAAAISSASAAAASLQSSADAAVAAAQANASSANAAAAIAQSSASAASLALISANSLVSIAQTNASSAGVAAAVAQASASQILNIANSIASDAKATATLALAQALASVSSVNVQASSAIQGARIEAMSARRFALILTFSILGSSLVSILGYFLLSRYRKARNAAREPEELGQQGELWHHKALSESAYNGDGGRSEYSGRKSNSTTRSLSRSRQRYSTKLPHDFSTTLPMPFVTEKPLLSPIILEASPPSPALSRKNTLGYDPAEPLAPPKFRSWLSARMSFADFRSSKEVKAAKRKEEEDRIRKAAIRKAREGEERREGERAREEERRRVERKRVSDERRVRARLENEEVVRKVSSRRERSERDLERERGDEESDDESEIGTAK